MPPADGKAAETGAPNPDTPVESQIPGTDAALVLEDGTVLWGRGVGAAGSATGEICFNTSMTGYQEILTDPSYAGQIITFTFPHIGNVGANAEDVETTTPAARGCVIRADITEPANWRAVQHLDAWLKSHGLPGIAGVDTRALTRRIRDRGFVNGCVVNAAGGGEVDVATALAAARACPDLEGLDLAREVTCRQTYGWEESTWTLGHGYGRPSEPTRPDRHVVAVDFGAKRNILRCLVAAGCKVTVVPATATAEDVMGHRPDGVFLSNGPGDPAATGEYAVPMIRDVVATGVPVFGICLGHQMLALALGCKTEKMHHGHRGANHPVKELATGKVEITSQNHGFVVMRDSLPDGVVETHTSLFDGTLEGLRVTDKPVFGVQHHPEASPGPQDSHYLFAKFVAMMDGGG